MSASGGCAVEGHCYSARRHLGGGLAPAALPACSLPSLDAQRARLERALCATTALLFVASVSYIALSTLFACFRAARRPQRSDAEPGPPQAVETKRALDEIPVVVVQVRGSNGCGRIPEGGAEEEEGEDEAADEECAVCLAGYAGGEEVRVLPACRHGFHQECVDRWLLTRAPTCPVCRAPVATSSEERDAKGCATGDAVLLMIRLDESCKQLLTPARWDGAVRACTESTDMSILIRVVVLLAARARARRANMPEPKSG